MSPVTFAIRHANGHAEIRVQGELDLTNAHRLRASAESVLEPTPPACLVIDLSEVTFCDVSAALTLVRLRRLTDGAGTVLAVSHPRPVVARLLELAGLARYLRMQA
jgi:anti-anti-sigma factor